MSNTNYDLVRQDLLKYLVQMHFNEYEGDLRYDTPLLQLGIIDSLSMMTCILFLEQQYGLDFFLVDVSRDDFASINTIANLVSRSVAVQETAMTSQ
jgi:acyl carrier protein